MVRLWFDKKQAGGSAGSAPGLSGPRVPRHSRRLGVLRKQLETEPGLRIIDTGYTSPSNINYLTSLGHSVYLADPVHDAYAQDWRTAWMPTISRSGTWKGIWTNRFNFSGRAFDMVFLWTALDYLPEPLVAPVVARLYEAMNPGGQVLAFFHTRKEGEDATRFRYHLTPGEDVEMQMTEQFPIQRAFTNRSIERLFTGWSGHRQFLAKDAVSEVIMTR